MRIAACCTSLLALCLVCGVAGGASTLAASEPTGQQTTTLKEKLNDGLKARLPEQFAFVDQVVSLVNKGRLPRSVVESTFLWAMDKPRLQFEYFQFGLRRRAKAFGVDL